MTEGKCWQTRELVTAFPLTAFAVTPRKTRNSGFLPVTLPNVKWIGPNASRYLTAIAIRPA